MDEIAIAGAERQDVEAIKAILVANDLPTAGVDEHWRTFVVARDGVRIIAVLPEYRSRGLGRRIVRQLIDRLASRGLREFYLLTTTAEKYFRKRGFKKVDRDAVHPQLLASREFQDACPKSAVCMRLRMLD
jgi:GNAT superfamily N-acetyltransferase